LSCYSCEIASEDSTIAPPLAVFSVTRTLSTVEVKTPQRIDASPLAMRQSLMLAQLTLLKAQVKIAILISVYRLI